MGHPPIMPMLVVMWVAGAIAIGLDLARWLGWSGFWIAAAIAIGAVCLLGVFAVVCIVLLIVDRRMQQKSQE